MSSEPALWHAEHMAQFSPVPQHMPHRLPPGHNLLFDADDTLWENNVYFEEAIARYISFLDHRTHTPAEVRQHLNQTERATIQAHGYGLRSFRASLTRCLEELLCCQASEEQHGAIDSFVKHIGEHAMELLDGVEETLAALSTRHLMVLVTKGNHAEQTEKLSRSGLAGYFEAVEVLREKDADAYRELSQRHGFAPDRTWMIGNSPRSDINPALEAGLNAVLVPHPFTWVLEHENLAPAPAGRILLEVNGFRGLLDHF